MWSVQERGRVWGSHHLFTDTVVLQTDTPGNEVSRCRAAVRSPLRWRSGAPVVQSLGHKETSPPLER